MNRLKICVSIFCSMIITISFSQKNDDNQEYKLNRYNIYLGSSTGINNMNGILGGTAEIRSSIKTSLTGAIGLGLWGIKSSVYVKYYKIFPKSFYYGAGYSWHSGIKNFSMSMIAPKETTGNNQVNQDNENIDFNFLSISTLNIICGHQWSFSEDSMFRIYVEGGYAFPLRKKPYEILTADYIDDEDTILFLDTLSPGGLILAAGVSIGF